MAIIKTYGIITGHKFLNVIAIKNNINIPRGSFVVLFKPLRRRDDPSNCQDENDVVINDFIRLLHQFSIENSTALSSI